MSTRNRLANEPNMPEQHKMAPKSCQALRSHQVSRACGWAAWICVESRHAVALCCRVVLMALLLSAFTVGSPAEAAGAAEKASASFRSADHVEVQARRAGNSILVTLRIDEGYHVNANSASAEYLIATSIAFEGVTPAQIAYPPAIRLKPTFADQPIEVYEGTVTIAAIFTPGMLDRRREIDFTLTAQACTEQICLPPDDIVAKASW